MTALAGEDGDPPPQAGQVLVTGSPGILDACLSADSDGRLLAIWNELVPGAGAILRYSFQQHDGAWTTPAAVCSLPGSCLSPVAARDSAGRPWVAFHSNTVGKHHIFVSWYEHQQWSVPLRISDGDGHCFAPAICPFGAGVRVVWEACLEGQFGIYMRQVDRQPRITRHHPQTTVIQGENLVANPAIAMIDGDRNLIVWERGMPLWGQRNIVPRRPVAELLGENFLRGRRELAGAMVGPDGLAPLAPDLEQALKPPAAGGSRACPRVIQDACGTVWLTWRQLEANYDGPARQGFRLLASRFQAGRWEEAIELPNSAATADAPSRLAAGPQAGPLAGYVQHVDGRPRVQFVAMETGGQATLAPEQEDHSTSVQRASLAAGRSDKMRVSRFRQAKPPAHATWLGQGGPFTLLWGDLHRHSDVSPCWWRVEGTAADTYRYALAVAQLDFLALTDHRSDLEEPDAAAAVEAMANAYNLPGIFTAFIACEINTDGQGHMVVLTDGDRLDVPYLRDRQALYQRLDARHHVVIPHHPGDPDHLYPWMGHNETLAPVAEIYQAYRTSFEAIGAPAPASTWVRGGRTPQPGHTLLDAWKSGLHVGAVASSDHLSTAGSLAGVWARGNSRRDILEALRARRCFGATDRIALMVAADGHLMGERFEMAQDHVQFEISCRGAAAIDQIELLCDGQVLHVFGPRGDGKRSTVRIRHTATIPKGEHFFTLRIHQQGDHMAWSSPIWISR